MEPHNTDAKEGIVKIEKVSKIINEAKNFLSQNECQKVLNKCEEGLHISGENDTLYLIQADALVKLKRYGEAIKLST